MYNITQQQKQQLEALLREATFRDVKTGDVINIFAMLQNLPEVVEKKSNEK